MRPNLYAAFRQLLFTLPPETSQSVALCALKATCQLGLGPYLGVPNRGPATHCMGLDFPNPVGLAAGLDKNGQYIDTLFKLGFGFIEIGTVTPRPQAGNSGARVFRIPQAQALINRLGFNSLGADYVARRLANRRSTGIVGVNIGKNRDTPNDRAVDDYLSGMRKMYRLASYLCFNLSSPNTPKLRELQFGDQLDELLETLVSESGTLAARHGKRVPLLVKLAPDLKDSEINEIAACALRHSIDGLVATNSTLARDGVAEFSEAQKEGGLSGMPLATRATEVVSKLSVALGGKLPIIGCGGIVSGNDAAKKISSGASLVQFYTGLIYRGPNLIEEAAEAIAHQQRNALQKQATS